MNHGITAAEIAARFQRPIDWWYRNKHRLQTQHGFPHELPGCPRLYPSEKVERWFAGDTMPATEVAIEPAVGEDQAEIDRALDQRAEAIARGEL